jgi:polyisoprenoid-binding protein YceI
MKHRVYIFLVIVLLCTAFVKYQPVSYKQFGKSSVVVKGTSTLHDWTMTSDQAACTATFSVSSSGGLENISAVNVSIPTISLKSGKGTMDKNAYKALQSDQHKTITFLLTSSKVLAGKIICNGNLTVAGTTKPVELDVAYENRSGVLYFKGSKQIKMSDFNVEAPSFMFGTVTTGDEITITFELALTRV